MRKLVYALANTLGLIRGSLRTPICSELHLLPFTTKNKVELYWTHIPLEYGPGVILFDLHGFILSVAQSLRDFDEEASQLNLTDDKVFKIRQETYGDIEVNDCVEVPEDWFWKLYTGEWSE